MENKIIDTEEKNMISPSRTAFKWRLLWGLSSIIYLLIGLITKESFLETQWWDTVISLVLSVLFIIMSSKEHRDIDNNGYLTYGRGLGIGTLTSVFNGLLSAIAFFIIATYFVDYNDLVETKLLEQAEKAGRDFTEEEMNMAKKFSQPIVAAFFSFLASVFFGFILSLVTAAIVKRTDD